MSRRRAAAILSLTMLVSLAASAQSESERRDSWRAQMRSIDSELGGLEREEAGLLAELERLERREALERRRIRAIDARLEVLEGERVAIERELAAGEAELRLLEQRLAETLIRVYKLGPAGNLRLLLGNAEPSSWLALQARVGARAREDVTAIERYTAERARVAALADELAEREEELVAERRLGERARDEAARERRQREQLLERTRSSREVFLRARDELARAARSLNAHIDGLVAGDGADARLDMTAFRGLLDCPVEAPVGRPFGDWRHPRFGTVVRRTGVDLRAERGASVAAFFEGEVVFADWFQGYGRTVIMDHGHGYHSVYAHLGEIDVRLGRWVQRAEPIGTVGDTGSLDGVYLYFEVRHQGRPQDPAGWCPLGQPGRVPNRS